MKNILLLSLLAAASTSLAAPAPASPVRQKLGKYIKSKRHHLASLRSINEPREVLLSHSSFGYSKVNDVANGPLTLKFGKTERHQRLRKLPSSNTDGLEKRQNDNESDNESELLNFDDTRYIACECRPSCLSLFLRPSHRRVMPCHAMLVSPRRPERPLPPLCHTAPPRRQS